jgi:hypothetical protein
MVIGQVLLDKDWTLPARERLHIVGQDTVLIAATAHTETTSFNEGTVTT